MTEQEIRDGAPDGATHYIVYGKNILYIMKLTFWYRHVYQNGFKDWHYCKPSIFVRIFRIKKLKPLK